MLKSKLAILLASASAFVPTRLLKQKSFGGVSRSEARTSEVSHLA